LTICLFNSHCNGKVSGDSTTPHGEAWTTSAPWQVRFPPWEVQLDEGVHMEIMLDNLFQLPCDLIMESQPQFMTLGCQM
jgi:hypothetical protein